MKTEQLVTMKNSIQLDSGGHIDVMRILSILDLASSIVTRQLLDVRALLKEFADCVKQSL